VQHLKSIFWSWEQRLCWVFIYYPIHCWFDAYIALLRLLILTAICWLLCRWCRTSSFYHWLRTPWSRKWQRFVLTRMKFDEVCPTSCLPWWRCCWTSIALSMYLHIMYVLQVKEYHYCCISSFCSAGLVFWSYYQVKPAGHWHLYTCWLDAFCPSSSGEHWMENDDP